MMKSWWKSENANLLTDEIVAVGFTEELDKYVESLRRLELVPYEYLVCCGDMLPEESIRFFYVDETWVDCLINGAMSVGRVTKFDLEHDALFKKNLLSRIKKSRGDSEEDSVRTGFLLRSSLVTGWPSLLVNCYAGDGDGKQLLSCERMAKIGSDTLLCIVDGVLSYIEFIEPTESICFGFVEEDGKVRLPVSALPPIETAANESLKSQRIRSDSENFIDVPFRSGANGVVDVKGLAEEIAKTQNIDINAISALEFSAELLETPMLYFIKGEL